MSLSSSLAYHALFHALKGVLGAQKGGKLDSTEACSAAWAVLDAMSAQMAGGFDPARPLPNGQVMGASLLRLKEASFNAPFFDQWLARYGGPTLFPASARLPAIWAGRLLTELGSSWNSTSKDIAPVVEWVLRHAPEEQLPGPQLPDLLVKLEAKREEKGLDPRYASLMGLLAQKIQGDPRRHPARWLASVAHDAPSLDPAQPVLAPSGRLRPLRELVALRAPLPAWQQDTPSPSALPQLPHLRRNELARKFVLDPALCVDEARARLWACIRAKPDVAWALLELHATPPPTHKHWPDRIADIFRARDIHGRGILALLACEHGTDHREECAALAKALLREPCHDKNHRTQLLDRSDAWTPTGQGLVEQAMVGCRQRDPGDALANRYPAGWVLEVLGPQALAGPPARQAALVCDLVDACLPVPTHECRKLAQALASAIQDPALEQALAWGKLGSLLHKPPSGPTSHYFRQSRYSRQSSSTQAMQQAKDLSGVVEVLTTLVATHPAALAIGRQEWTQWWTMFFTKSRAKSVDADFLSVLEARLPDIERIVSANTMQMDLPQPARRIRSRM